MPKLGVVGQKGMKKNHQPSCFTESCVKLEPVTSVLLLWDKNSVFYKQENILHVRNISNILKIFNILNISIPYTQILANLNLQLTDSNFLYN